MLTVIPALMARLHHVKPWLASTYQCASTWVLRSLSVSLCHFKKKLKTACRSVTFIHNYAIYMYRESRNLENVVVPVRALRGNDKTKLKVQHPKGELYRKSPKYRGHLAWNKLEGTVQRLDSYEKFVSKVQNNWVNINLLSKLACVISEVYTTCGYNHKNNIVAIRN